MNLPFLEFSIIIFGDIRMRAWKSVNQQYRAWSDFTDVQASLALYWWQMANHFWFQQQIRVKGYSTDDIHVVGLNENWIQNKISIINNINYQLQEKCRIVYWIDQRPLDKKSDALSTYWTNSFFLINRLNKTNPAIVTWILLIMDYWEWPFPGIHFICILNKVHEAAALLL